METLSSITRGSIVSLEIEKGQKMYFSDCFVESIVSKSSQLPTDKQGLELRSD
jgi:hypothetical protein